MAVIPKSLDPVIRKLNESIIKHKDGKISFHLLIFNKVRSVLLNTVKFSPELPELERSVILKNAIFNVGEKTNLSRKALEKELRKLEKRYLRQPIKPFILVSSISIDKNTKVKRCRIGDTSINITPNLPIKFQKVYDEMWRIFNSNHNIKFPTMYQSLRARVNARTASEAASKALYSIDIIRGIWNLFCHKNKFTQTFGKRNPVNKIILGPLHTIHDVHGYSTNDVFWFEPNYLGPVTPKHIINLNDFNDFVEYYRYKIKNHNYRSFIEDVLIRYTRALDEYDWNNTFLRLWSVLEYLTMSNTYKFNYDKLINRAIFIIKDRDFQKQVLQHLREYRNKTVHSGENSTEIESYIYQLKFFVDIILDFHINNDFKFKNPEEAIKFLDLPVDKKILKEKVKYYNEALKLFTTK